MSCLWWNFLFQIFFCENTKWKIVPSPHYLEILLKSTKYGLSYNLKLDQKSISKATFVLCCVLALLIQNLENFSQKLNFLFKSVLTWQNKNIVHPSDLIQAEIMLVWITNSSFCEKFSKFCINRANTKQGTNVILEIDFWSCLRL